VTPATREKILFTDGHLRWRAYVYGGEQGCPWGCETYPNDMGAIIKRGHDDERIEACVLDTGAIDATTYSWIDTVIRPTYPQIARQMKRIKRNYSKRDKTRSRPYALITRVLPHLIQEHYFFEGRKSKYRADPTLIISALNLAR